jgi:soluble lytic murein transglycosylase-like protein
MKIEFLNEINSQAKLLNLDSILVAAIVATESSFNPFAVRYEPNFKYRLMPYKYAEINGITETTENFLQSCSIGLMQTMGLIARENGFTKNLLELTIPENSLSIGCKKLASLFEKYKDENKVIVAYNAGSINPNLGNVYKNSVYLNKVLANKKIILEKLTNEH